MTVALAFLSLMELLKLEVLASWYFLALPQPFPVLIPVLSFLAALLLARALGRTQARRAVHLLLYALAFSVFGLAAIARYHAGPAFGPGILPQGSTEAFSTVSVLAWTGLFSFRGAWLGRRDRDHAFAVARFDEGLGLFLLAFLFAALVGLRNAFAWRVVLPYFLLGILALGVSKNEASGQGGLGMRSRAALLTSIAAVFALAALALAALIPALLEPARWVADSLKTASRGLFQFLLSLLERAFSAAPPPQSTAMGFEGGSALPLKPEEVGQSADLFATIFLWITLAVVALTLIALIPFGLAWLYRILSARIERNGEALDLAGIPAGLRAFLHALLRRLSRARPAARRRSTMSAAKRCYSRLLVCGRLAGAVRLPAETPREYAGRLARSFPCSARAAGTVLDLLEREAYGGEVLDAGIEARLRALRRGFQPLSFLVERGRREAGSLE